MTLHEEPKGYGGFILKESERKFPLDIQRRTMLIEAWLMFD